MGCAATAPCDAHPDVCRSPWQPLGPPGAQVLLFQIQNPSRNLIEREREREKKKGMISAPGCKLRAGPWQIHSDLQGGRDLAVIISLLQRSQTQI